MPSYTTTVDLRSRALADELSQRADRLERRALALSLGAEGVVWPEGTARDTARFYLLGLRKADKATMQEIMDVLVDEAELSDETFWGTELGRALFALGAFPSEGVERSLAQRVLGLKSRQRVHQLVVNEELVETQGLTLSTDSVRALMVVKK